MAQLRNILFVCTGNVDRSPTAEGLFKNVGGLEVKSAGTSIAATVPLTRELIEWADEIRFKVRGNMKYLFAVMDDETRFWITQEVADTKYTHDCLTSLSNQKILWANNPKATSN